MNKTAASALSCALLVLALSSCESLKPPRGVGAMSDYFYWRGVADAVGWAVFLPGSSGLTVLDDDQHYYAAAEALNARGWNVLLVDYKSAYRAAVDAPGGSSGEKIAWVAEQATDWLKVSRPEMASLPGAVIAWSLGAEGAIELVNDRKRLAATGIRSAAMYYPSIPGNVGLNNHVPVLVLTGELDDVTPLNEVKALVENREPGAASAELLTYSNAHHGFDVASIREETTIRVLPLVGRKMTLQYNADAASDAAAKLYDLLDRAIQ